MGTVAVAVVIAIALTIVEVGVKLHTIINSDFLYLPSLFADARHDWTLLRGWVLTPAPYFFPDMPFLWLLRSLVGDDGRAMTLYAAGYQLSTIGLWHLVARAANVPRGTAFSSVFATWLFCALAALGAPAHASFLVAIPSNHGGTLLTGTGLVLLSLRGLRGLTSARASRAAPLCLLALGALSDPSVVWQFAVPLAVASYLLAREAGDGRRAALRPLGWTAASVVAAGLARISINAAGLVRVPEPTGFSSTLPPLRSFVGFGRALVDLARSAPALVACGGLSVVLTVWLCTRARPRSKGTPPRRCLPAPPAARLLLYTAFVSLALTWLLPAIAGNLEDGGSFRYLWPTLYWTPYALVIAATRSGWLSTKLVTRWTYAGSAFAVLAIAVLSRRVRPGAFEVPYDARTQALDQLARDHDLRLGYSDYWNAKQSSYGSRTGLRVNQLRPDLTPYLWINNARWYLERGERRFIVTNGLDTAAILAKFGPPATVHDCAGLQVFVYEHDLDRSLGEGFYAPLRALAGTP